MLHVPTGIVEVALPLQKINEVAARAVVYAQMVGDPSAHPDAERTIRIVSQHAQDLRFVQAEFAEE